VNKSWAGTAITGLIIAGIALFLLLNLETGKPKGNRFSTLEKPLSAKTLAAPTGSAVREYPIGDEVEKNSIRVAAVWLPAVMMDSMPADPNMPMIHIEADVKALENNPNGFAKDEKVDYLTIDYSIVPAEGGTPIASGKLTPMMARDGFHYGASIAMPNPGQYRLVYDIQPPSSGGLGRHSDPATGVAEWWKPFQATFDWTVEPDAVQTAAVGVR